MSSSLVNECVKKYHPTECFHEHNRSLNNAPNRARGPHKAKLFEWIVKRTGIRFNARLIACLLLVGVGVWHMISGVYIQVKAEFSQILLEDSWRRTLLGQHESKPWPWADTWPIARLMVPRLNQDLIVLEGGTGATLAFGPGRLRGSVELGENGVSVIGGHRDTHFAFLQNLKLGDQLLVDNRKGNREVYRVQEIQVTDIRQSNIRLEADEPLIALVACYPFDAVVGGPLRYVVLAAKSTVEELGVNSWI